MTSMVLLTSLLVVATGAMGVVLPWLEPPTELFAVTVPPSAKQHAQVRSYRHMYALAVAAVTLACAAALPLAARVFASESITADQKDAHMAVAVCVSVFAPIVASLVLMLHYRTRTIALKRAEGWETQGQRRSAAVGLERTPAPLPLAWNLLYAVLAACIAVYALTSYDRFADQIPINAGLDGTVSVYAPKSAGTLLFPALVTVFMGVIMTLVHWMVLKSKRPVDPAAPATSALAYAQFARLQSILLLVGGLVLSAGTAVMFYLPALGIISLEKAGFGMTVLTIAFVLVVMGTSIATGQAGGRLAAELRTSDAVARDDDRFWKLGMFYVNADDPSIIVPKRFGVGWTINHARPAAWLLVIAIVLVSVAFAVLTSALVG